MAWFRGAWQPLRSPEYHSTLFSVCDSSPNTSDILPLRHGRARTGPSRPPSASGKLLAGRGGPVWGRGRNRLGPAQRQGQAVDGMWAGLCCGGPAQGRGGGVLNRSFCVGGTLRLRGGGCSRSGGGPPIGSATPGNAVGCAWALWSCHGAGRPVRTRANTPGLPGFAPRTPALSK